jgi:hypothetical protein
MIQARLPQNQGDRIFTRFLGREPIKPEALANVCFGAHNGLKSDIAPCPKCATTRLMHRSNDEACPHSGRPAAYKARVVISSQSFGPEPRGKVPERRLPCRGFKQGPSSLPGNERRSVFRSFSAKALKSRSQCQIPPLVARARRRRLRSLWRCAAEMRRESRAILPCPRSRHSG